MSLFDENMNLLKSQSPMSHQYISEKIYAIDENNMQVKLCRSKSGHLNIAFNDSLVDQYVHSNYNPEIEAERWASSLDTNVPLIVIFGLGLGYHIRALRKRVNKDARIVIIEPDMEIFKLFLENSIDIRSFDKNTTLILKNQPMDIMKDIFEMFKRVQLQNVEIKLYSGYFSRYVTLYREIEQKFYENVKSFHVNISTQNHFKYLWLVNFLSNCRYINNSCNGKVLYNKFKGIPAIVVSAGPSLNKNVEYLKDLKEKALIIAGASAIGILKKHGISPHFMVAMDGDPKEKEIFDGIDFKGIPLIYTNKLFYEIIPEYEEKKFFFSDTLDSLTNYFEKKIKMEFDKVIAAQTVASVNAFLTKYMGCGPIIFVGQDFSFPGFELHAEGAAHMLNFEEDYRKNPAGYVKMKDINGNDVYTMNNFLAGKMDLEEKILHAQEEGYEYINATEGGLGIGKCVNMKLTDVIDTYMNQEYDITSVIDECFERSHIHIDQNELDGFFYEIFDEAYKFRQIVNRQHELCNSLISARKDFNIDRFNKKTIELNKIDDVIIDSDFYKNIVKGSIGQTLDINNIVFTRKIQKMDDAVDKNIEKLKNIDNKAKEMMDLCDLITLFIKHNLNLEQNNA